MVPIKPANSGYAAQQTQYGAARRDTARTELSGAVVTCLGQWTVQSGAAARLWLWTATGGRELSWCPETQSDSSGSG